jgi:hypothetical protein
MAERNVTRDPQMERETLRAVFWILCKCSVCPPFVTWQTSSWQLISAHYHCSKSWLISETAAMICLCSLGRSCCRDCRKARVLNIFPYHHCHLRNWSWNAAAGMDGNGLLVWYLHVIKGGYIQPLWGMQKYNHYFLFFFIWDQAFRSAAVSQPLWLWLISCMSVINDKALYFLYLFASEGSGFLLPTLLSYKVRY